MKSRTAKYKYELGILVPNDKSKRKRKTKEQSNTRSRSTLARSKKEGERCGKTRPSECNSPRDGRRLLPRKESILCSERCKTGSKERLDPKTFSFYKSLFNFIFELGVIRGMSISK